MVARGRIGCVCYGHVMEEKSPLANVEEAQGGPLKSEARGRIFKQSSRLSRCDERKGEGIVELGLTKASNVISMRRSSSFEGSSPSTWEQRRGEAVGVVLRS